MDAALKRDFADLWARHFPSAELPLAFFFSDDPGVDVVPTPKGWRCFVAALAPVRRGKPLAFGVESLGCEGARQYAGFIRERSSDDDAHRILEERVAKLRLDIYRQYLLVGHVFCHVLVSSLVLDRPGTRARPRIRSRTHRPSLPSRRRQGLACPRGPRAPRRARG